MSSSRKELEERLKDAGHSLLNPPSDTEELLKLLDEVEDLLSDVRQAPSTAVQDALLPTMTALISNKLLRHSDKDVKVSVASCISEITRITAPEAPYNDEQMKEIFQLTVSALENLSHLSTHSYTKAVSILKITAKVRSIVMMLDLDCYALILEMFQRFLNIIRADHPHAIFTTMETIMTMVFDEIHASEEIPLELLKILLSSVKKENQKLSPFSWKLGETVLDNCSSKLKPYLMKAVKSMGTCLDDYAHIVASICQKGANSHKLNHVKDFEENPVTERITLSAACPTEVDKSVAAPTSDEPNVVQERSFETLQRCHLSKHSKNVISRDNAEPKNSVSLKAVKTVNEPHLTTKKGKRPSSLVNSEERSESEPNSAPKKRGRKPNSLMNPDEGYDNHWMQSEKKSPKSAGNRKIGLLSSLPSTLLKANEQLTLQEVTEPSTLPEVTEPSTLQEVTEPSTLQEVTEPSTLQEVTEPSTLQEVTEPTTLQEVTEPTTLQEVTEPFAPPQEVTEPSAPREVTEPSALQEPLAFHEVTEPSALQEVTEPSTLQNVNESQSFQLKTEGGIGPSPSVLENSQHHESQPKRGRPKKQVAVDNLEANPAKGETLSGQAEKKTPQAMDTLTTNPKETSPIKVKSRGRPRKSFAKTIIASVHVHSEKDSAFPCDPEDKSQQSALNLETGTINDKLAVHKVEIGNVSEPKPRGRPRKFAPKMNQGTTHPSEQVEGKQESPVPCDLKEKPQASALQYRIENISDQSTMKSRRDDTSRKVRTEVSRSKKISKLETKVEGTPKSVRKKKRSVVKEEDNPMREPDDRIVGKGIKVWWPQDRTFYEGVVIFYDGVRKKHRVLYTDGEEEHLNLRKQRWQLTGGGSPEPCLQLGQKNDTPKADGSDTPQKKLNANSESSEQANAGLSSKRTGVSDGLSTIEFMKCGSKAADGSTLDEPASKEQLRNDESEEIYRLKDNEDGIYAGELKEEVKAGIDSMQITPEAITLSKEESPKVNSGSEGAKELNKMSRIAKDASSSPEPMLDKAV